MKSRGRMIVAVVLGLLFASAAAADTLELRDGRVLHGRYLGGTQAVLRFEINGQVQTFNVSEAVALTFTGSVSSMSAPADAPPPPRRSEPAPRPSEQAPVTSQEAPPPAARPNSLAAQAEDPAAQYGEVTIPAGQSLLVRMIDGVDSSRNHVGDVFHASLETDLYANNMLVARKGTDIYGRLANAKEAGHMSGSAELQLELIRIVIDGHDYPLVSSDYSLKGKGRGADTAKKVGGGAVVGAIIGAIAGGGQGAAIGAGVGSAAGAGVQVLTKGQQVKVPSETLLEFRLQQPAVVTPTQG
ncbi:MAG TPA: hypothetical protein VNH65_08635 [Candidatus Acidoferrum sp.]|nr:hypothetical protein [Candidatus Acidoferrum sp.]